MEYVLYIVYQFLKHCVMQRKEAVDYASGILLFDVMGLLRRMIETELTQSRKLYELKWLDAVDKFLKVVI